MASDFLTWTVENSGATGSVVFDPILQRTVFKCVGNGTPNGYAKLVKTFPTPKSFLLIRLIFEAKADHTWTTTTLRHLVLKNSSDAIIGGYGHATNGVTVLTINTVNPSSNGVVKEAGNILEAWLFFKRDSVSGYAGAAGNIGANSISRVNYNAGTNDFAKIEVGCIPITGGAFSGTVNIIACDVYDSTPEDVSLIYPTANLLFYQNIPSIIELIAPNDEPLTALTVNGTDIFFSDINSTRNNAKATLGVLVDSSVFTSDDQYEGALVKFTAPPFEHDLPAQVLWTQAAGTRAFLNRFAASLFVEGNTYTTNSQTTTNQTYTLTRCVNLPNRKRWIGLPSIDVAGRVEVVATFGTVPVSRWIDVAPSSPAGAKVSAKGLSLAIGCDDGLLEQTILRRETHPLQLYNSIMCSIAGTSSYTSWGVIKLLDGLGFKAVSHLLDANPLNSMSATLGAKYLTLSRNILMQQGYQPWMFVAPNGQVTSSGGTSGDMLPTILSLFSIVRGSTALYYTNYPQNLSTVINSVSIQNSMGSADTILDSALSGASADSVISMNVHTVGVNSSETSHTLLNNIVNEAKSRGILISSLYDQFIPKFRSSADLKIKI